MLNFFSGKNFNHSAKFSTSLSSYSVFLSVHIYSVIYSDWPSAKHRPRMQKGQSERCICQLWPGSDNYKAELHLNMQSFHILVIFWLFLWILNSSWLNIEGGALL